MNTLSQRQADTLLTIDRHDRRSHTRHHALISKDGSAWYVGERIRIRIPISHNPPIPDGLVIPLPEIRDWLNRERKHNRPNTLLRLDRVGDWRQPPTGHQSPRISPLQQVADPGMERYRLDVPLPDRYQWERAEWFMTLQPQNGRPEPTSLHQTTDTEGTVWWLIRSEGLLKGLVETMLKPECDPTVT